MRKYYSHYVKKVLNVKNLVTIEYLNISSDFSYAEEVHSFYEFVYVDGGSIKCITNNETTVLEQNDFYLILPNTPHHYESNKADGTGIFLVCFNCNCDILELLGGKNALNDQEKHLMSLIFSESKKAFSFPFNKKLVQLEKPSYGAQQLMEGYIEALLISLVRRKLDDHPEITFVLNSVEFKDRSVNDIIALLKKRIYSTINLDEVQNSLYYSKTYLNGIFKKATGMSIIHYYRYLKIEEAKKLIKNGERVVDISDKLNFDSPNYFSKVFKSLTGLTPTEYKKKI